MTEQKKFVFVELYNLHLAIRSVSRKHGGTRTSWLDRDGKEKLVQFFKEHAPNLTRYVTAHEIKRKFTTPSGEIKIGFDGTSSLGWYKLTSGIPWFESEHFLPFASQYKSLRKFVHEYLKGKLSLESLLWLQGETSARELRIFMESPEGKAYGLHDPELSEKLKKIPLSEFQITADWTAVVPGRLSGKTPFPYFGGIELKSLFFKIYDELAGLLERKYEIGRCAYETKCKSIFWKSRITQKYCTPGHRSSASSTRYYGKWIRKK